MPARRFLGIRRINLCFLEKSASTVIGGKSEEAAASTAAKGISRI
jgi:hypothetical protein